MTKTPLRSSGGARTARSAAAAFVLALTPGCGPRAPAPRPAAPPITAARPAEARAPAPSPPPSPPWLRWGRGDDALDPAIDTIDQAFLAGANETQALIGFSKHLGDAPNPPVMRGFFVVDLESGCIRETKDDFTRALEPPGLGEPLEITLGRLSPPRGKIADWLTHLQGPAGQAELQSDFALMHRFGLRSLAIGSSSYTTSLGADASGRTVVFDGGDRAFRSLDGGATFDVVERGAFNAGQAKVSADGRFIAYSRSPGDRFVFQLATAERGGPPSSRGPTEMSGPFGFDPSGRYVYHAHNLGGQPGPSQRLCLERVPLGGGPAQQIRCFAAVKLRARPPPPSPYASPGRKAQGPEFYYDRAYLVHVSPGAEYALVSVPQGSDADALMHVVSLRDGRDVDTFELRNHGARVDDRGVAIYEVADRYADPSGPRNPQAFVRARSRSLGVGAGSPLGWAPDGRLIVFDVEAALARSRCHAFRAQRVEPP